MDPTLLWLSRNIVKNSFEMLGGVLYYLLRDFYYCTKVYQNTGKMEAPQDALSVRFLDCPLIKEVNCVYFIQVLSRNERYRHSREAFIGKEHLNHYRQCNHHYIPYRCKK